MLHKKKVTRKDDGRKRRHDCAHRLTACCAVRGSRSAGSRPPSTQSTGPSPCGPSDQTVSFADSVTYGIRTGRWQGLRRWQLHQGRPRHPWGGRHRQRRLLHLRDQVPGHCRRRLRSRGRRQRRLPSSAATSPASAARRLDLRPHRLDRCSDGVAPVAQRTRGPSSSVLTASMPAATSAPSTGPQRAHWPSSTPPAGPQVLFGWGLQTFSVTQISLRQAVTPRHLLGRGKRHPAQVAVFGIQPVGAVVGGALASAFGLRIALLVAAVIQIVALATILFSPLRDAREASPADAFHRR